MGLFSNKKPRTEVPKPDTFNFGAPRVPNLEKLQFPEPRLDYNISNTKFRSPLSKEMGSIKQSLTTPSQNMENYNRETTPSPHRKSLFIKVDRYRDALHSIEEIKSKVNAAEAALANLERTKRQEEAEIEKWKRDVESIKKKLMNIDSALFRE
ncbi:hypothetical protein J4426_00345 [Candidatus Woesearchaeota archaeon]|nr:hypothetical protein [Candidatus Woesearchaeota archaeon]